VENVEQVGVDTVRSRRGIASRAREGETLGAGEPGRRRGELRVLAGGVVLVSSSAMVALECRDGMGCVTGGGGVFWGVVVVVQMLQRWYFGGSHD
jgi:hypothetical protein